MRSVVLLKTPVGWQHAVLVAPGRLLTHYMSGVDGVSLGNDAFMLAENTCAWVDGTCVTLDPRTCMLGNSKTGFCFIALGQSVPRSQPLPLPAVEPWPVDVGEQLSVCVLSTGASSLLARARAAVVGGMSTTRLGGAASSCDGATIRFRAAAELPSHAFGAPVFNARGEWVGLMCAHARTHRTFHTILPCPGPNLLPTPSIDWPQHCRRRSGRCGGATE